MIVYSGTQLYKAVTIAKGDMILLNDGHEMRLMKDTRMVELKQGPCRGREHEKIILMSE